MEKKMTQREALAIAIETIKGCNREDKNEVAEKLNAMITALDKKKNGGGKTKEQKAIDERLLGKVLAAMSEKPMRATEICALVDETISTSKFRALIKASIEDGTVINTKDKKNSYFSLA